MARKKQNGEEDFSGLRSINYGPLTHAASPEYETFYKELSNYSDTDIFLHRKKSKNANGYTVVRKEDIREVKSATLVSIRNPEYNYRQLAGSREKKHMRSFVVTLKGSGENSQFAAHKGEEFILVQKGAIKVYLGDNEETLREGDSIYYISNIPHRIENLDSDHSIILAVLYGA